MDEHEKQGTWSDPELEARVDNELEPLMKAVEEKAKELGLHGVFIAQAGRLRVKEEDDGSITTGYRGLSRGINTDPFNDLMKKVKDGSIPTPKDNDEAKEFFENNDTPGPTIMLAMLMAQGDIDAEAVLAARIAAKEVEKAIEENGGVVDASHLAQLLGKALGAIVTPVGMQRRPEKVKRAWDIMEDDDGNVIGFRDPETGEEDLLN